MTQDDLTKLHLMAPAAWDMDSSDVDAALKAAGLNPGDPSGYTLAQGKAACRAYAVNTSGPPYALQTRS